MIDPICQLAEELGTDCDDTDGIVCEAIILIRQFKAERGLMYREGIKDGLRATLTSIPTIDGTGITLQDALRNVDKGEYDRG